MSEYAKKCGEIISNFLLEKMKSEVQLVVPGNYTMGQNFNTGEYTLEGELIYFLKNTKLNLSFKIIGKESVQELASMLRKTR